MAEKFDVDKLDMAKVVTLEYAGKRNEAAILNQASSTDAGSPLYLERYFKGCSLMGKTTEFVAQILIAGLIFVRGNSSMFTANCY